MGKSTRERDWDERFAEYVVFRRKHPDEWDVPRDRKSGKITALGYWLKGQRAKYSNDNASFTAKLTDEELKRLKAIGFKWKSPRNDLIWTAHFNELLKYKEKHGDCNKVSMTFKSGAYPLGSWVSVQRASFGKGILKADRMAKLNAIGFAFEPGGQKAGNQLWEDNFAKLKVIVKANNLCVTSTKKKSKHSRRLVTGSKLCYWMAIQRHRYKLDQLSDARVEKLASIGFEFETTNSSDGQGQVRDDLWDTWYQELVAFQNKHCHCNLTGLLSIANQKLANWVCRQRMKGKGSNTEPPASKDQIDLLDKLGGEWNPAVDADSRWDDRVARLQVFQRQYGHMDVPLEHDFTLSRWVPTQGQRYEQGIIQKDRQEKLEQIGLNWEKSIVSDHGCRKCSEATTSWRKQYLKLDEFRLKNGHCVLPKACTVDDEGDAFSRWIAKQRRDYKSGTLHVTHRKLLDGIGFTWEGPYNLRSRKIGSEMKNHDVKCLPQPDVEEEEFIFCARYLQILSLPRARRSTTHQEEDRQSDESGGPVPKRSSKKTAEQNTVRATQTRKRVDYTEKLRSYADLDGNLNNANGLHGGEKQGEDKCEEANSEGDDDGWLGEEEMTNGTVENAESNDNVFVSRRSPSSCQDEACSRSNVAILDESWMDVESDVADWDSEDDNGETEWTGMGMTKKVM